jgi:hypothetical protein
MTGNSFLLPQPSVEELMPQMFRTLFFIIGLLLVTSSVYAGGVDPREMPKQEPVKKEEITATPEQTSAAVSKARRVVAPEVKEERVSVPTPKAIAKPTVVTTPKPVSTPAAKSAGSTAWMVSNANGTCSALSSINRRVNVGTYKTPQELAYKIRQRGHQAFALDIGDTPDQVMRVKSPDHKLDVTFVRAGMCR